MVKARSPGYPSIGLPEAVEKISLVYKKDYQNKIPRLVVAQHAGYQSLNGKSLGVLAALAKYGLLEGRGDENWVSDLALQIIAHDRGSPERAAAIAEAAATPELFAEISARFPAGASDAGLRSYLLTKKFIPQAADIVARCYRETKLLVIAEGASNITSEAAIEEPDAMRAGSLQHTDKTQNSGLQESGQRLNRQSMDILAASEREYVTGNLSKTVKFRLIVSGGEVGGVEIDMLIRKLKFEREILGGPAPQDAEAPPSSD